MLQATKTWLFQKISSVIMVPFMIWFLMNIVTIFNGNYDEVVNFFTSQPSKILFSIFELFCFLQKLLLKVLQLIALMPLSLPVIFDIFIFIVI